MTERNQSRGVEDPPGTLRVLLAKNEISTRKALETSLGFAGFDVATADDGTEALRLALDVGFDIIVVDLTLPVKNGSMVCEELRASQSRVHTPVVMLSASDQLEDRLQAFGAGADDCVTEPFEVMELIARIRAIVRRTLAPPRALARQIYKFGHLRVDTANATVWREGKRLRLSMMEYELLQFLVRHPGEVLSRQRILEEVWDSGPDVGPRAVDMHVAWLRKKIWDAPPRFRWIRSVHGEGYLFVPD